MEARPTANERLKERSREIVWLSLMTATAAHFLVLAFWPPMQTEVWADGVAPPPEILQFEDLPIPAPPPDLTRPAMPVMSTDVGADATIEPIGFTEARELPPPPPAPTESRAAGRGFEVFEVAPRLLNPAELQRELERVYPKALRDAGIGGVVSLQIFIDESGRALEARVAVSSGFDALDRAAVGLIEEMRFSAAMNRDRRVPVWVQIPIEFRTRR